MRVKKGSNLELNLMHYLLETETLEQSANQTRLKSNGKASGLRLKSHPGMMISVRPLGWVIE